MEIKRKVLAGLIVIGLVALAINWGTYSWFSDAGYSKDNIVESGTLDIKLWGEASPAGWYDNVTATWSVSDFAPNQTKTATLSTLNVGSISAYSFYFGISSLTDGLSSQIFVTEFLVSLTGTYNHVDWMATTAGPWVIADDGILTLEEFGLWAGTATPYGFMIWGDGGVLPPSDSLTVTMTLLFNPDAGNEYQGKSCSFDVKVAGYQEGYPLNIVQVGGGSSSYGYGN